MSCLEILISQTIYKGPAISIPSASRKELHKLETDSAFLHAHYLIRFWPKRKTSDQMTSAEFSTASIH
jgi:hypothetical protein